MDVEWWVGTIIAIIALFVAGLAIPRENLQRLNNGLQRIPHIKAWIGSAITALFLIGLAVIIFPEPKPAPPLQPPSRSTQVTVFGSVVRTTSGGTSDGKSRFCQKQSVQSCARPEHGGSLISGSGRPVDVSATGQVGSSIVVDSPSAICAEFWASTTACETEVSIQGRVAATEKFETH